VPKNEPASNAGETVRQNLKDTSGDFTKKVDLDPSLIDKTDEDVTIQAREILIWDSVLEKFFTRQILSSDKYGSGVNLPAQGIDLTGVNPGDLIIWDTTGTPQFVVNALASLATGDLIRWNDTSKRFEKVTPVEIEVLTDLKYIKVTQQVVKRTRTIKAIDPGAESGDTIIVGGQAVVETLV